MVSEQNNCLHEIFFEQAIEHAGFLDDFLATNREPIGPLHGLPISLKDQFHVGGVDTAMGYVGHIGSNLGIRDPSETHKIQSQITKDLLSMGAVLYCKTSLPQTLFFGETKNNIIGQTLNPANRNLSCGGSSGGEGALQALNGSCLGVGTDSKSGSYTRPFLALLILARFSPFHFVSWRFRPYSGFFQQHFRSEADPPTCFVPRCRQYYTRSNHVSICGWFHEYIYRRIRSHLQVSAL